MSFEMNEEFEIKQQVREFYDQIGWQEVSQGCYQNAVYEDLREVSSEYVHRCHLRVLRHLKKSGRYLLDAGSGPIQYPEYLEYSRSYNKRICLDISFQALQEARKRISDHGLYVVGDIAHLPFKSNSVDGLISLHTIHHLPQEEHLNAYLEFQRVLSKKSNAVVVNGWDNPPLMTGANLLLKFVAWSYRLLRGRSSPGKDQADHPCEDTLINKPRTTNQPRGTYVRKHNASWLTRQVGSYMHVEIWTWRSISVRFLRTMIHERWGGRILLRMLYSLEELFPHFFGRYGQYPLIVITKN
jgi:ubiquinone/menaquinone biosynthesis C-methylase UbiE